MIDRIKFYNKILRNKTIVKRIESYDFIPSLDELMVNTYYSYKDINDKISILEDILSLKKISDIDSFQHPCDPDIIDIINKYRGGITCLSDGPITSNISYILTDIDNYCAIDNTCFTQHYNYNEENKIHIFSTVKDAIEYAKECNANTYTIYTVDKYDEDKRFKASYGLMEDGNIHLYQITDSEEIPYYTCRPSHPIPYINDSKLGYYLPFMKKPEYLGKAFIEQDGCGVWYGWANFGKDKEIDMSYLLNDGFNNIATYDIICDYQN